MDSRPPCSGAVELQLTIVIERQYFFYCFNLVIPVLLVNSLFEQMYVDKSV